MYNKENLLFNFVYPTKSYNFKVKYIFFNLNLATKKL